MGLTQTQSMFAGVAIVRRVAFRWEAGAGRDVTDGGFTEQRAVTIVVGAAGQTDADEKQPRAGHIVAITVGETNAAECAAAGVSCPVVDDTKSGVANESVRTGQGGIVAVFTEAGL